LLRGSAGSGTGETLTTKRWTRSDITDAIRAEVKIIDGQLLVPRVADWRHAKDGRPSYMTVIREFGSWQDALREAGVPEGYGQRGRRPAGGWHVPKG